MSRRWLIGCFIGALATIGVVWWALGQRSQPISCSSGLVALGGTRCCGTGQQLSAGRCVGVPTHCGPFLTVHETGCIPKYKKILIAGGRLLVAPDDWESEGVITPRQAEVDSFHLDDTEVTVHRWNRCVVQRSCRPLEQTEPGQAVAGVSPTEAERFCRHAGGRLPTRDEWLLAAMGVEGRRFPWGQTGLVCRRAVFAMVRGPCAWGASGPELVTTRPDGRTPEGVFDLAGNVAEWTREATGVYRARGGSFRSQTAAELKSWSIGIATTASDHVGFRCAYPI